MATTTTRTTLTTEQYELHAVQPAQLRASQESQQASQNWENAVGRSIADDAAPKTSKTRMITTIVQLAAVNLLSSLTNGVMTVGLPTIGRDINLPRELYLWPLSVYGLTCGSMLLMAGSITDVVGARRVELAGCFALGIFVLACGLAETGIQLTLFRAFQGVAMAVHLPAAVSIATSTIPKGKGRNMAFAALGFARDIGYSVGLVLGGIIIQTRGWRLNFHLAGGGILIIAIAAFWSLPTEQKSRAPSTSLLRELGTKVDWAGSIIISSGLAILAYVLA